MAFSISKPKGTTDVSVPIMVIDASDGTPETGYAHDTSGIDLWYRREGGSEVSITEAALAAWNSAHSDGGVEHGSDGRGRLDLPDAACAVGTDGASYVEYGGTITDMIVIGGVVNLTDPVNELFSSVVCGDTGNAVGAIHVPTWTYGDDEINDYVAAIKDVSTNEWHYVRITDWVNSTKLASFTPSLPESVQDDTDLVCLLGYMPADAYAQAGDEMALEDDAITAAKIAANAIGASELASDAVSEIQSGLATASALATVDSNVDAILADTDELQTDDVPGLIAALPTAAENRAEMDSNSTQLAAIVADTNELQTDDVPGLIAALDTVVDRIEADTQDIQGRIPASLNNGVMPADVQRINDVEITGDGDSSPFDVA